MSVMDDLAAEVARETTVVASTSILIDGLVTQLQQSANDPAKIQELIGQLKANNDVLAAAVQKNTPAVQVGEAEPVAG